MTPGPELEGAVPLASAGDRLAELVARQTSDAADLDPLRIWDAFREFLNISFAVEPPLRVQSGSGGDMMLLEWSAGTADPPDFGLALSIHLVRQVTLEDQDGDYHHMEQTVCDFRLCVPAELRRSLEGERCGLLWGDAEETQAWIEEVEQSPAFPVFGSSRARRLEIFHTEV